jgi:hypothetical protein
MGVEVELTLEVGGQEDAVHSLPVPGTGTGTCTGRLEARAQSLGCAAVGSGAQRRAHTPALELVSLA